MLKADDTADNAYQAKKRRRRRKKTRMFSSYLRKAKAFSSQRRWSLMFTLPALHLGSVME